MYALPMLLHMSDFLFSFLISLLATLKYLLNLSIYIGSLYLLITSLR